VSIAMENIAVGSIVMLSRVSVTPARGRRRGGEQGVSIAMENIAVGSIVMLSRAIVSVTPARGRW
jgi:hypothetical protein